MFLLGKNNCFHVGLQIEAAIVRRKKMELIQRYATDTLLEEEDSIRKMLGV